MSKIVEGIAKDLKSIPEKLKAKTGNIDKKKLFLMNLPYILAQGRTAYEYIYPPQEYLDREHDYHLDFLLKGDSWAYCDIVINVLSWSKRVQNHEF